MDVVNIQVIKIELIANENYKELYNRKSKSKQIMCIGTYYQEYSKKLRMP